MKPSTYVAALVRGHLRANPPLPAQELTALKQSVAALADVSRMLRHLSESRPAGSHSEALTLTRRAVKELEYRTQDLAKASLMSWESRCG
jgi:hypothetical protein